MNFEPNLALCYCKIALIKKCETYKRSSEVNSTGKPGLNPALKP